MSITISDLFQSESDQRAVTSSVRQIRLCIVLPEHQDRGVQLPNAFPLATAAVVARSVNSGRRLSSLCSCHDTVQVNESENERGHGEERVSRFQDRLSVSQCEAGIKSRSRTSTCAYFQYNLHKYAWAPFRFRCTEMVTSTFSTRFGFFQRKRPYSDGDDQWVNGSNAGHVVKPTAAATAPTSMVAATAAGTGSVRQRPPSLSVPTTSDRHRSSYDEYQCVLLPGDEVL